jgi:hypothetical protein
VGVKAKKGEVMNLRTIKELYDKVKAGEIDESKLVVIMDNDCTSFYVGDPYEADEPEEIEINVSEASGYHDIEALYPLLFPKATVEWV